MRGKKWWRKKIYSTYRPYPVSRDLNDESYSSEDEANSGNQTSGQKKTSVLQNFDDLIGDTGHFDRFPSEPMHSNAENSFRPYHLVQSLFADRLNFLQRALDELESAKKERQQLVKDALDELDSEISQCDRSIATLKAAFNNTEQQRHIERKLLELKRDRRREALLSWRDLVWLKGEIRKLQREIDTIGRTSNSNENKEAPT